MIRPRPKLTLSEWADRYFYLSPESSSTPGKWRTLPYQREPMDIILDPTVHRITFKKSARVGYTKSCITIPIAYAMHYEPRSMLLVLPTEKAAEGFSKNEIAPMLRDVVVLHGLVDEGAKKTSDTILEKHFSGGALHIGGANSARVFRNLTVSRAFLDETSAFERSAGGEGNAIKLAQRRMGDAWDGKLIEGSSPKIKGACSISDSFEQSDQRHFFVPCPRCDHGQRLQWGGKEFDFGIKWPSGKPEEAYYLCEQCRQPIEHREKRDVVGRGQYESTNPTGAWPGFHIWAAYSFMPDAAWSVLAHEFLECGRDPEKLQVFENTIKGEAFENLGRAPSESGLLERREAYTLRETGRVMPDGRAEQEAMVPAAAAVLVSGTDVQHNRLETQVVAVGLGEEMWALEYHVLYGDPTALPVWAALFELLTRPRHLERGGVDFIRSSAVDSNYAAQDVYRFVGQHSIYLTPDKRPAYLWAVRGSAGAGHVWPKKPGVGAGTNVPVYTIKVDAAKDAIFGRLQRVEEPGPGYIHFPHQFDETYFHQLTSEHAIDKTNKKGFAEREYQLKKGRQRNEALDTLVQSYAALCGLYAMGFDLEAECDSLRIRTPFEIQTPEQIAATKPPPDAVASERTRSERRRTRWVDERRDWMGR